MTTTTHNVDDITITIMRRVKHEIAYIMIEQDNDIVVMTRDHFRAVAQVVEMNDIFNKLEILFGDEPL